MPPFTFGKDHPLYIETAALLRKAIHSGALPGNARLDSVTGLAKKFNTSRKVVENALKNIEDGDIILMHEIYTNSYEATCIILERLDAMGFEFVTVSELIGAETLSAGQTYYSKTTIR